MSINIVGLGYVGLNLASVVSQFGIKVIGIETDIRRREAIRRGGGYIEETSSDQSIKGSPIVDLAEVPDPHATATVFCVQTPTNGDGSPDLTPLLRAISEVVPHLDQGALVIVESTVGPKDNEISILPAVERVLGNVGTDFNFVYAPERVDPGRATPAYREIPRIVAGATEQCTDRGIDFYSRFFTEVIASERLADAEMAKLLENSYRLVNIALVNEIANLEDRVGFDMQQVVSLASTKPFGFHPFYPSAGAGGHCIPVDPAYLRSGAMAHAGRASLIDTALQINACGPAWTVQRLDRRVRGLPIEGKVLICGVAYKAGVPDLRNAPALEVLTSLSAIGQAVCFWDPLVSHLTIDGRVMPRHYDGHCAPSAGIILHSGSALREAFGELKFPIVNLDGSEISPS